MKWLGAPATVLVGLAVLLFLAGSRSCAERSSPDLLEVLEMAPGEAELGDRIALLGRGFPSGKPARVTFRGALHRPGERDLSDAEIVLPGTVTSPQRIEVSFDETAEALFCGGVDRAIHTTFEGDVEVAFASATAGAPPVAGVLRSANLDVRPSLSLADSALAESEGRRVLAWIGVSATEGGSGLFVEAVEPRSRAEEAGIKPGDTVSTFNGVRVASAGDLVPPPGQLEALVGVRQGRGSGEALRHVSIQGFRRAPSTELLGALLVVIAALAVVAFFAAPTPPRVAAAIHRVASRIRARRLEGRARASSVRRPLSSSRGPGGWAAADWVEAAACAALVTLPFGQYLVASRLDVGVLFVAAATTLATSALVAPRASGSGWTASQRWRGLRDAAHVVWQHLPAALAVAGVIVLTGSLRIQEIERAQGGWPWEWLAFRTPPMLVALLSLLTCARIEPDARDAPGLSAWLYAERTPPRAGRGSLLESACRVHRIIVAGLACSLFLGGWRLPGLSAAEQDSRTALELAGGAWFLVKTCSLSMAIAWTRWAVPGRTQAGRSRATALWFAPASAAALAATFAWTRWSPAASTQAVVSDSLVAVVSLAALALAQRLRHGILEQQRRSAQRVFVSDRLESLPRLAPKPVA